MVLSVAARRLTRLCPQGAVIMAGTAASRAEAIGWVLARIRERPAYAKLGERARELEELKARF